jgi:hypothetical protein
LERVKQLANDLFEEIRVARDASPLPMEPDRDRAGRLMVDILRRHLAITPNRE